MFKRYIQKRNLGGKHNHWIWSYLEIDKSIFIGTISHLDFSAKKLKGLGVEGPMEWTGKTVQKCVVSKEVGQYLKTLGVDMGAFTEIGPDGKQLSHAGQGL